MFQIRKWVPTAGLMLFFTFASHAGEVDIPINHQKPGAVRRQERHDLRYGHRGE